MCCAPRYFPIMWQWSLIAPLSISLIASKQRLSAIQTIFLAFFYPFIYFIQRLNIFFQPYKFVTNRRGIQKKHYSLTNTFFSNMTVSGALEICPIFLLQQKSHVSFWFFHYFLLRVKNRLQKFIQGISFFEIFCIQPYSIASFYFEKVAACRVNCLLLEKG